MWGNFVDKAKVMAANIDQQLNESVGVEGGAVAPLPPQDSEDNAWNDDFDFDDDDDIAPTTKASVPPLIAEEKEPAAEPENPEPEPSPPIPEAPEPVVEEAKNDPVAPSSPEQTSPEPASEPVSQPASEPSPEPTAPIVEPPPVPVESPAEEIVEDGWGGQEDDPIVMDDGFQEQQNLQQEAAENAVEVPKEKVEEENIDTATEQEKDTTPQPAAIESLAPEPQVSLPAASSMFTNLTSQASTPLVSLKDLTSQASTPLASLKANLSTLGSNQAEEPPKKRAASLFTSLASAVDSALDKAVDKAPKDEAPIVDHIDDGGWDEDDNFDVPDDTEAGESESIPPPATKMPETKSDTVNLSKRTFSETPLEQDETIETIAALTEEKPVDSTSEIQTESSFPSSSSAHVTAPISNIEDEARYMKLQNELRLREDQLANKSEQLTQLQSLWENQEMELKQKIQDTKEEAKKRITRAKERCEAAEARLKQSSSKGAESTAEKDQIITELREEGESLARKQSQMEQAVRAAHGEIRELKSNLAGETEAKGNALEKNAKLEAELKIKKESLKAAQKGESQAGKLEEDLLTARSDAEMKASTILSLQQQVKELLAEGKELKEEVEKTRKSATQEAQQERKSMRREHNDVITDLETKLRTTEREAGVREDALRHEVTELRKRWEDAVRRADALSMDVQSSTAPLLRQLESMERQNRARAAGWAELENRLRSELEETVIQNETLSKERSEFKTKYNRLERSANETELELKECRKTIEDQTSKICKLESQMDALVAEAETRQEEYLKVERLANEGVMRVRSEMTQTVVDSEERYRGQIDKLEGELRVEKKKRSQLEKQVEELLDNTGMIMHTPNMATPLRESKPKKLRKAEGQAEILAGALGLDDSDDESDDDLVVTMERGDSDIVDQQKGGGMSSFAALEQLTSRLKAAQVELEALRRNLRESEKSRESLVTELAESRSAKEKLPLFEAKVKELTEENREMELEIRGLRDDISEVRELYRAQLNVLLEEKASKLPLANGEQSSKLEAYNEETMEA